MPQILITLALSMLCLPATGHDGTATEHLLLGLDTGIVQGTVLGFVAGVACTLAYLKSKSGSH